MTHIVRLLTILLLALPPALAHGEETVIKVSGYFCSGKAEWIAFLNRKALGDNDIMAANAVNKTLGKPACNTYLPLMAIPHTQRNQMKDGLVYQLQSFIFLPEREEYWTGSVLGSLQSASQADHDI